MKENKPTEKRSFLRIFKNGHINHCNNESYKGGKSGLKAEMRDDRTSSETSICLNDKRSTHHTSKKYTNIKYSSLVFKKQYYSTLEENMGLGYKPDNRPPKIKFGVLQREDKMLSSRKERKF